MFKVRRSAGFQVAAWHAGDSMSSVESRHIKMLKQLQQCKSLPGPGYPGTMEKAGGPGMATG